MGVIQDVMLPRQAGVIRIQRLDGSIVGAFFLLFVVATTCETKQRECFVRVNETVEIARDGMPTRIRSEENLEPVARNAWIVASLKKPVDRFDRAIIYADVPGSFAMTMGPMPYGFKMIVFQHVDIIDGKGGPPVRGIMFYVEISVSATGEVKAMARNA